MTNRDDYARSVSAAVGLRARELRSGAGLKVEDVAKAVTARGLRWTPARVSELEAGKVAATISNLTVLSGAFADLLKRPVRLADWFEGEGMVTLTDEVRLPLDELQKIVAGAPVSMAWPTVGAVGAAADAVAYLESHRFTRGHQHRISRAHWTKLRAIYTGYGEAEERAAKALGVDKGTMCELMLDLWGETLSVRRDRIAEPGANAQKRGRIARQLRQELEAARSGKR